MNSSLAYSATDACSFLESSSMYSCYSMNTTTSVANKGTLKLGNVPFRSICKNVSIDLQSEILTVTDDGGALGKTAKGLQGCMELTPRSSMSFEDESGDINPSDWSSNTSLQTTTKSSIIWVKDEMQTHCKSCTVKFHIFLRKHHCRKCGEIFCNRCLRKTAAFKKICKICMPKAPKKYKQSSCFM